VNWIAADIVVSRWLLVEHWDVFKTSDTEQSKWKAMFGETFPVYGEVVAHFVQTSPAWFGATRSV